MITTSRPRTTDLSRSLAVSTLPLTPTPTLARAADAVAEELLGGAAQMLRTLAWEAGRYPELALDRRTTASNVVDELGHTALQHAVDNVLHEARALTIRQPWTDAILHMGKRVVNRARPTGYRGLVLLHAARDADEHLVEQIRKIGSDLRLRRQAIVGSARLADCHHATLDEHGTVCCEPWGEHAEHDHDRWHWQLANVRAHTRPVLCSGAPELWRPAQSVLDSVIRHPGEVT
ncbi:hypothetical protein [Streptomyces sp. NPDC017940]|uniref:hypothetical protein n=1 Tax=Streptomyces sp. NPDC017940 TaxID=3365017 RepID=UPI0037A622CE